MINTQNTIDPAVLGNINAGPAKAGSSGSDDLRTNFMTLLIAQLKNQDPLNPLENAELTSQLAQINTLSGIEALNDTLSGIAGQLGANQDLQAAGLIGKGVMVPGDRIYMGGDGSATPFGVELAGYAHKLQAQVVDGSGQVVRSFDLGATGAGVHAFLWDGSVDGGGVAAPGAYRVLIDAVDAEGNALASTTLNYALINAVTPGGTEGPLLDLGGVAAPVTLADIRQIL
ncbi:MAG: flagellar hook assembly protein FlgD [Pseudomonas sp.]